MNNYKDKVKQDNRQQQHNIQITTGLKYDNPQDRAMLDHMANKFVSKYYKNYNDHLLNTLIRLEALPTGYSRAVEVNNQLQVLLCAEILPNWWLDQKDCHIICMLKQDDAPADMIKILINDCEQWAQQQGASTISIYSWNDRPAYDRWCGKLGYNPTQKTYTKELK